MIGRLLCRLGIHKKSPTRPGWAICVRCKETSRTDGPDRFTDINI